MKEEAEIMDELQGLDGELKSFPPKAHWFCPRRRDDDDVNYDDPDEAEEEVSLETKRELIEEAKRRHEVAYKYSLILGLAPDVSGRLLHEYTLRLNELLTSCDKCVHNWHLGRKAYLKDLSEQFDEETVAALSGRLDSLDFQRLDAGLARAEKLLAAVDPPQRNQGLLAKKDTQALLALYEALCCVDYHGDDDRLAKHFDYVFEQAQNRKVLRISDILPAMARFLFSKNPIRHRFAANAWAKMTSDLTPKTFEWVVHDVLSQAIMLVANVNPNTDPQDVERFWQGFLSILERMDEGLIRHCLRGMEIQPDIYRLALQHLAANSEKIAGLVIDSLRKLLVKAPKDFWAAMGTISPATVAEQIFQSPGFEKMVQNPDTWSVFETSPAISWISVLLKSLDPVHQYDACRKMLETLFFRFQNTNKFSEQPRLACCRAGLDALHVTLQTFLTPDYQVNSTTSLIVISNIMGLVKQFQGTIIGCADLDLRGDISTPPELKQLGMVCIKDALALDCKAIYAEFHAHLNDTKVQRGTRDDSQAIWQAVLDIFRPGNLELVKYILPSLTNLTGLDILLPEDKRLPDKMPKDHIAFNKDIHQLFDNVAKVLDRLNDFSARDLNELMSNTATARILIACLISADEGISQASVETIKVMTSQETKGEAFETLLSSHLAQTLSSMQLAIVKVYKARTFGPVPYMIKNGRAILTGLCGNTGVLRVRSTFDQNEKNAVLAWWNVIWRALDVVFSSTEAWAPRVDKTTAFMQDFLRETMEFAEKLFDEHSIIASVLGEGSPSDSDSDSDKSSSEKAGNKKVLEVVCQNINGLVGMIRLRDTYLISVITSLLGKLLRSLSEYDLEVTDFATNYIRDACKRESDRGFRKTNLTAQQKAELQRALDENVGIDFVEIPKSAAIKKQSTIDSWSKSADGQQHEPRLALPAKKILPFARPQEKHLELIKAREAMAAQQQDQFKEKRRREREESKRIKDAAIAKAKALRGPTSMVQGEGSGIKGIGGVAGKDHAPARNEIMVGSSDEDSSDDDDDEDETNALVKRRKETSKKVSEYEESKRRAFKLAQEGPVKKTKIQRSAKDARARVDPDMTKLYQEILNWDIFHPSDAPPGNNECRKIDNSYVDLDLYKRTFGPLLVSEVWRSLVTAKDENNYKAVEVKVLNRVSVDKFLEVSTTMPIAYNKDLKMSERDIVLFSKDSDPLNSPQAPHCLARVDRTTRKKDTIEITYRISRDVDPGFLTSFVPNGKVYTLKICDMTTTQREFAALSSLEYYDLCPEVLEARPSPLLKYPDEKISNMSARYSLNRGQAKAILSANDNDGFTLIQGPPGSGKTKTIVAMVGALLTPTLQQQQADQARVRPPTNGKAPPPPPPPKKKLLICAPSNAAVDELVVRLMEGVQPLSGPRQKINVLRIGRSDAINAAVKSVMLDELVRVKLEGDDSDKNKLLQNRDNLHKEAGQVKERLNVIRPQMEEAQSKGEDTTLKNLRREFDQLKRRQAQLGAKIDEDKDSGMTVSRQNEISRRRFQQEIINGAHVICSTLSGSGHDMFKNLDVEFETVIIDEAAQCIELSALIPLKYGCSKCILVGDPEQLPPTVLSRSAQSFGYEQSLFVRMQKNHPKDIHLLDTQYRMHPEISRFPSAQFYQSRLVDGEGMAKMRVQPWHASTILGPYRFFDVKGVQTKQSQGHSFINVPELNAALSLYQRLKTDYSQVDFKGKIGIITSYKAQLNELKARFAQRYTDAIFEEIEFNTTDAFQGREREIIIFSCVRAKETGGIGFLGDIRRMNVGLTRAKSSLWVLGDSRALQQGRFWNALIQDAQARGRYTSENVMELFSRPTERRNQPAEPEAPLLPQPNGLPSRTMSTSSASGANNMTENRRPSTENEDEDVVMIDAPRGSEPRKPSVSSTAPKRNLLGITNVKKKTGIKQESRPSSANSSGNEMNAHGKRPREGSDDSPLPGPEKVHPREQKVDLDAALRAQQAAARPPAARPPRPPGVPPPRKRPAADPFIQRKPPPKR
ncbi:related to SEN1 protein [Phialocephala subalpina]|uniref:Related to SEN1 protein n=1 Tax=Phialocephala subalpina TaxID=576137 RepID=A0A1L7WFL2_9HELO|nr:related to SEN1 protein [Phialocephala subalpina]